MTRATSTASDADRYIKWELLVDAPMGNNYPVVTALGNKSLDSEIVISYEVGWRYDISQKTLLDVAAFYNDYDNLKGEVLETQNLFTYAENGRQKLVLPLIRNNILAGGIYGIELYGKFSILDSWNLSAGYSYLKNVLNSDYPLFLEGMGMKVKDVDPEHKALINSRFDLSDRLAWDVCVYYVDALVAHKLPNYVRLDTRIGWKFDTDFEFELVGQNLLDDSHSEYVFPILPMESTKVETTFFGRINYRY